MVLLFQYVNSCVVFFIIVPIWNILVSSVSSSSGLAGKGLVLWPKGFTLENYRKVFSDSSIPRAFLISVLKQLLVRRRIHCSVRLSPMDLVNLD